jgi:hypothetical protein
VPAGANAEENDVGLFDRSRREKRSLPIWMSVLAVLITFASPPTVASSNSSTRANTSPSSVASPAPTRSISSTPNLTR